jgi:PIN domain nuclease of toxin-antitoxin system
MKLLLDTHVVIWAAAGTLSAEMKRTLLDERNELYFSSVNIWEIVIKRSLRKDGFDVDPASLHIALVRNGYTEIPLTAKHTLRMTHMPWHHKDPFDRILLSQAIDENMTLLTADRIFENYDGPTRIMRPPATT